METIEFNEVIKQNIEVGEGLLIKTCVNSKVIPID